MSRRTILTVGAVLVVAAAGFVAVANAAPHHQRASRASAQLAGTPTSSATYAAFDSPSLRRAAASSAEVQRFTTTMGEREFVGQVVGLPHHIVAARHADGRICYGDARTMLGGCSPGTWDKLAIGAGCDVCDEATLTWFGVLPDQVTSVSDDAGHSVTPTGNAFVLAGVPLTSAVTLTSTAGTVTIPAHGPLPPARPGPLTP